MSVDINWERLTTGPDGTALAESIRDFIHQRFQTVTLPRFIKQVSVHAFEFGSIAPEIEIKDICDPLPDFYEEDDEDQGDGDDDEEGVGWQPASATATSEGRPAGATQKLDKTRRSDGSPHARESPFGPLHTREPSLYIDTRPGLRSIQSPGTLGSPFSGAGTPGISGGTSNLNYFHSQLATGLSGTQTPLAAVAGAHLPRGWPDYSSLSSSYRQTAHRHSASASSISPPSTAGSNAQQPSLREQDSVSTLAASSNTHRPRTQDGLLDDEAADEPTSPPRRFRERRVEDLQTVFRVRYSGDVKLSLTAEILLDYPMPSFVGIPVKLNITGLSFDGVAVVAYIRKRAHFCFLSPEDAVAAIGAEDGDEHGGGAGGLKMGGLLQEIKVESEIGQRENGKQSLKNVGKMEKFVLEQVRRIFEDEFVYPSFWTFLV
jgi:mitochondrial distribution and morphology protein 12